MIVPYACHEDTLDGTGGVQIKAPSPLLPNWGAVNDVAYWFDMVVRYFQCSFWMLNIIMIDADFVQLTRKDDPTI